MADKLGLMTVPSISNSIPWLTYLNTVLLILIIIYIAPYRQLQTVAAGALLPNQVTAFIPNANYFITSTSFLLDAIFIIAFLIITAYIIWKWATELKNKKSFTSFKITLFAGKKEITLDLGKSAFKVNGYSELISDTPDALPKLLILFNMEIDWQGYIIHTGGTKFHLPHKVHVKPWQLTKVRQILPNLTVLQLTAYENTQDYFTWTIPYQQDQGITSYDTQV